MHKRKPLNVLYLTGALSYGGMERVIINLCCHLDREKFRPIVVCIKSRGEFAEELEKNHIKVINLNANRSRALKHLSWLRLTKIIRTEHVDIIHSHNTGSFLDGIVATRLATCKTFIHTDHARSFPDKKRYMIAERLASLFTSKIVAVSHETRDNLMQYEKIRENKIVVINNGVEKERFDIQIDGEKEKELLGLGRFEFVVGLGVVLTDQKGIEYLIKAAPLVLEKYPQTGFVVAGDGPIRTQLEKQTKRLGIANNFVFLGARNDIPRILQVFDIYVLPSIWEGLPLVILEAMAASKCILATNVGGIPAVIQYGVEGILIDPGKSQLIAENILMLAENSALREKLSRNAYNRFLKEFTVETMVKRYEGLYLEAYTREMK